MPISLVHVVDGSDVNPIAQIDAVHQVIREVQAEHHAPPAPELLVVNKIDVAAEVTWRSCAERFPERCSSRLIPVRA